MSRYRRLLRFARPYFPLLLAAFGAAALGSVLDGFSFAMIIPFLRAVFGESSLLPAAGSNDVSPKTARRNGMIIANENPSSTDPMAAAPKAARRSGRYGRANRSSRR